MEWIEVIGKTVEGAKESALDKLGVGHDEAEFVVVDEPRKGLFRQTRGTARVRARVIPRTPPAKVERRSRRPKADGGRGDGQQSKSRSKGGSKKRSSGDEPNGVKQSSRSEESGQTSDRSNDRSGRSRKEEGAKMVMTLDEQIGAAEAFLTGLLEEMGISGQVTSTRTDEANAHVNVEGDDLGLLIGPGGATMNALQDLTRVALQKQAAGSWEGHVHVDVNGYRARRREALVRFVEQVADDVRTSGKAKALEPMASSDRKIVHDTVNAIEGVHTSSEGYDPKRWVKISPEES